MRKICILVALYATCSLALVGCGDDDAGTGGEGQACFENGTCDGDLTCVSGYCVELPPCGAGDTRPCTCTEGEDGAQVCEGEGVWGECNCTGECGNGVIEADEECDGTELGGESCETKGYGGGTLTCDAACLVDTSDCDPCGNGLLDAGEVCDGSELDGETCETQGFGGGALGCDTSCQLDTSGCDSCGNGVVDAGEACDGTDLAGETCETQGYSMGPLACDSCAFDASACLQCNETHVGDLLGPLMMVVILDRSGSMSGSKWDGSKAALNQFFSTPDSEGITVSLSYFPPDSADDECDPLTYNPPHVGPAQLPADAQTLATSMDGVSPGGLTPTYGALQGSLAYAVAQKDLNPGLEVVVVLATDGDPTSCNTGIPDIAALATSAFNYNGVRTYAVAIQGSTVTNLDQIAQAGGGQAFDVTSDITLLTQRMEEIRSFSRSCALLLPAAALSDPANTNIMFTPWGGASQRIGMADDANDCGTDQGWYLDDPSNPTGIELCPATCTAYQADVFPYVEAWVGCPTELN